MLDQSVDELVRRFDIKMANEIALPRRLLEMAGSPLELGQLQ